ncbi:MAG: molecular chaperone [Aestuariivirga sp.]
MKQLLLVGLLALGGMIAVAQAAALQVAPVRLDVPAPGAASKITLRNTGDTIVNAQVRVFRWTQVKGKDVLAETRDVVASPPIVKLDPAKSNVIRIVRTSKTPIQGEEAYRLIVDELPPAQGKAGLSINFVLRYSIPVFFNATAQKEAALDWSVRSQNGKTIVTVVNSGGNHLRLSGLSLKPEGGKPVDFRPGLVGYVLANSTARFELRKPVKGLRPGATVLLTAEGNDGPVQAKAEVAAAN